LKSLETCCAGGAGAGAGRLGKERDRRKKLLLPLGIRSCINNIVTQCSYGLILSLVSTAKLLFIHSIAHNSKYETVESHRKCL